MHKHVIMRYCVFMVLKTVFVTNKAFTHCVQTYLYSTVEGRQGISSMLRHLFEPAPSLHLITRLPYDCHTGVGVGGSPPLRAHGKKLICGHFYRSLDQGKM